MEEIEGKAIDTILEKGVDFTVKRTGFLRLFSKTKTYHIAPPALGCLLEISKLSLSVDIDEDRVTADPWGESWAIISATDDRLAKVLAVAILHSRIKIKLFTKILAKQLMWQLTTRQLINAVSLVLMASNPGDFLNTIRLIRTTKSLTTPKNLSPDEHGG